MSFVLGHLMLAGDDGREQDVFDLVEAPDATDTELITFLRTGSALEPDTKFEFGLDIAIAGLRARFDLP